MILLIVGATERAIGAVREVASSHSIDIRIGAAADPPDWVMTSTAEERADAIRRYGLPGYRVIEFRDLGTIEEPRREVVRTALARMSEIGRLPRRRSRVAAAVAKRAIPPLTEWASWLAADEARQKIAAHAAFLQSKHGTALKGWVLFVLPDVQAFTALSGLLNQLSRERHVVHAAITHVSAGDPDLAALQDPYTGLTVGRSPDLRGSPWRPLARALRECLDAWRMLFGTDGVRAFESAAGRASPLGAALARSRLLRMWPVRTVASLIMASIERALPPELDLISFLEDRKPDVLVVVPHRSIESIEADYFRTARRLGIRSVCLPLRWDDLNAGGGLRYEAPDAIALWNEEQRREVTDDLDLPADRIEVTGPVLPSDVLDGKPRFERGFYCDRMGIDPSRRIVLIEAPIVSTRASIDRFHDWRRRVKESAIPEVRDAAVVVYVHNPDEVPIWRRLASTDDIFVARAGAGERRALVRLYDSLVAADVVMPTDLTLALEARARATPVIVLLDTDANDNSELARFCRAHAGRQAWPVVARSTEEAVARLATPLCPETAARDPDRSTDGRAGEETGALAVYRLLDALSRRTPTDDVQTPPPAWQRLVILWCASRARRFDAAV